LDNSMDGYAALVRVDTADHAATLRFDAGVRTHGLPGTAGD
jgi:hypothetical protein